MTPTVRFVPRTGDWVFGSERRGHNGADSIVIKQRDLDVATATDLVKALRLSREHEAEPDAVFIDTAPDDEYSPKESLVDHSAFELLGDSELGVRVSFVSNVYLDNDAQAMERFGPLVEPLLKRRRMSMVDVRADPNRSTAPYYHELDFTGSTRGRRLREFYEVADAVTALLDAAGARSPSRTTVVDLILGGHADLLIGQPEGPWLDAKSQHYDLTSARGQIALAQSVSRFCNAEDGGVVVVGLRTRLVRGGEIISALRPVPLEAGVPRRYRQVLERRLFPLPTSLRIEAVETSPRNGMILVSVPPQDEELKPFLVHGAIVGRRVEGAFISIVRRSGEDSVPITAQQIHSSIAAGRALLRRGQLP